MTNRILPALLSSILVSSGVTLAEIEPVDFNRDIRPLLSDRCFTCHGPDEGTRKTSLRLDRRESAMEHAVRPGDATGSELIARVASDDTDIRMPPDGSKKQPLTRDEVSLLRRWIEQGAEWQEHWAFVAPERPTVPMTHDADWPVHAIDSFLLKAFEVASIEPSPSADRRTLLRRLHFDVLGLPPPPTDVDEARLTDRDWSDYYASKVDELLQSPAFGERMASYWLDVVRYADSCGIHGDQVWSMSPYRDYVINAFNDNMPFDQFLREQLAGDLLPNATRDQKIASAFNRMHMVTAEGGAQSKEYLAIYAADRVRNTSAALMGVTMGCAQCHDHKFDPFTTREFYEFAAFFADLNETGVYGGANWYPQLLLPTDEQQAELDRLNMAVDLAKEILRAADPLDNNVTSTPEPQRDDAQKAFDEAKKKRDAFQKSLPSVIVSESVSPRPMRVLPRGNWLDDSGDVVQPGVPDALLPIELVLTPGDVTGRSVAKAGMTTSASRLTRLDLAEWMTHPNHPLVARVFVNRLWKLFFGRGIVATVDDFGFQGESPVYPQLLDWLAAEFIESGWDVKHLVGLIVTSNAYQQSSRVTASRREADPLNRRFARQSRFRIDAEMIRDNALFVSGLLVRRVGGRSVRPYQPAGYYAHLNFPRRTYQADTDDNVWRRTVYTHWQRTFLHPSLKAFDAPTREECTADRPRSNTPIQSLVLLNDPIYVEAARSLAARTLLSDSPNEGLGGVQHSEQILAIAEVADVSHPRATDESDPDFVALHDAPPRETLSGQDDETCARRIRTMFRLALQRPPNEDEIAVLAALASKHNRQFQRNPSSADALLSVGTYVAPAQIDRADLATWTSVARVVLNLHESIVRY